MNCLQIELKLQTTSNKKNTAPSVGAVIWSCFHLDL